MIRFSASNLVKSQFVRSSASWLFSLLVHSKSKATFRECNCSDFSTKRQGVGHFVDIIFFTMKLFPLLSALLVTLHFPSEKMGHLSLNRTMRNKLPSNSRAAINFWGLPLLAKAQGAQSSVTSIAYHLAWEGGCPPYAPSLLRRLFPLLLLRLTGRLHPSPAS